MHVILDDSAQIRATQTHPLAEVESNRQREKKQTGADNCQRYHDPCPRQPSAIPRPMPNTPPRCKTSNENENDKRQTTNETNDKTKYSNTPPRTSHNKDQEHERLPRDPLRAPSPRQNQLHEPTMSSRTSRCPRFISPSVQIPFLQVLMCDLCRCEVQSSIERCRKKMHARRRKNQSNVTPRLQRRTCHA